MERVQRDDYEADRASIRNSDEGVTLIIGTARSDRVSLTRPPVRMKAKKDRVTQDVAHRSEDRSPRKEGELNDRLEVFLAELANLDRVLGHGAGQRISSGQAPCAKLCGARPTASAAPVGRQQSKRTALLGSETFPDVSTALTTISAGPVTLRQYAIVLLPPMEPSSSCCTPLKYTS